MTRLSLFCLLLLTVAACAPEIRLSQTDIRSRASQPNQKVHFYDRHWKGTTYEKAAYYRIVLMEPVPSFNINPFDKQKKAAPFNFTTTFIKGPIVDYYMNGAIQSTIEDASLIDANDDSRSWFMGKVTQYNRNGTVALIGYYQQGKRNGAWTTFDAAGNITSQVYFDKGKQVATPEQISSNNVTTPATRPSLFRTAAPPPAYTGPCACVTCFGKRGMVCSECGGDGKKCGNEYRYVTEWVYKNVSKPVSVSEYDYSCKCYRSFTRYKYVYERVQERVNKLVSTCDIACTRCNQSGRLACITCSGSGKGKCDN